MPLLTNRQTGQQELVPDDMMGDPRVAELYDLDGATYQAHDPSGRRIDLPAGQSMPAGYDVDALTPEEAVAAARGDILEEEHGGLDSEVGTFLEGAAQGLTLGGYGLVQRLSNPSYAEDMRRRAEVNPDVQMAGEIVGAAAPAFFSGGGALAATPAGLASRLGTRIAARGAERGLLARTTYSALGSAAEGSLFGAGQALSQITLSDEELSAERIVGALGHGALLGAGIGGAVGAAGPLVGGVVDGTTNIAKRLVGGADNAPSWARKALGIDDLLPKGKIAKKTVEDLKRGISTSWNEMDDYARSLRADAMDMLDNEAEHFGTATDRITGETFSRHGPQVDEIRKLTKQVADDRKALSEAIYRTDKKIVRGMADRGGDLAFTPEFVANMSDDHLKAVAKYWDSTQRLSEKMQGFGGEFIQRPAVSETTQRALARVKPKMTRGGDRRLADVDKLDQAALLDLVMGDAVGIENIPLVGSIPGISQFLQMRLYARMGIKAANKIGGLMPNLAAKANGAAEKTGGLLQRIAGTGAKAAPAVAKASEAVGRAKVALTTSAVLQKTQIVPESRPQKDETPQKSYRRLLAEVDAFPQDPVRVEERIARNLPEAVQRTPGLVRQMAQVTTRKVSAIGKALPRDPRPQSLGSRWQPTKRQLEDLAKVIRVLDDPDELLSAILGNRATRSMADAVREVYPRWFAGMQAELTDRISERADDMPYRRRLQLSDVLGIPLDPSRDPEYVRIVQEGYQRQSQPAPQGGPNPSPKIDLSSQLTDGQRGGRRIV